MLDSASSFAKFIFGYYVNIVDNLNIDIDYADLGELPFPEPESVSVHSIFASSIERLVSLNCCISYW